MITKLAGTLFGVAILMAAGSAFAAPAISTFRIHSGDNAGRAYPGEDEYRNNNDQLGAGAEHARCNVIPNAEGGPRVMCIATASYTDIPNSPVTDRIQGLCTSHRLDPQQGLVQTAMKYVSQNDGDEYQNYHSPSVVPIFGGTAAVLHYNYDPDNNTELYAQIVTPDCEILKDQTKIFEQNNDNVLGQATNPVVVYDSPTEARITVCGIGNGNGNDDAWCVGTRATNNNGTYTLERYFAKVVENEEERSRIAFAATPIPDHIFECAAVGNTQPPNRGVRCSLLNTAPDVPNENRVVWRQYIEQREGEIYRTTPSVAPILAPDGSPTDTFVVSYVEVDTSDRNGRREKGATFLKTVPVKVTLDQLEMLDTPKYDMVGFGDQAHQTACGGFWGPNAEPVGFVLQGSIVGSVTGVGRVAVLGYDTTNRRAVTKEELVYTDSSDMGWISQYYGNNPNTPQGRNHSYCMMVANPGYGVAGGFQPEVKQFLFVANTSRNLRVDGTAEDKLAYDLVLIPAVVPQAEDPDPTPEPDPDPDPTPEPEPTPDPDDSGAQVGGCSTTGNAGAGSLLLLGLAFGLIRRRRAQ